MTEKVVFPIAVKFEDGTTELFDDVASLETDLEVFDSESSPDCEVTDALGRVVRLRVSERLELKDLSLIDP